MDFKLFVSKSLEKKITENQIKFRIKITVFE